jgi:hypothetical protein
MRFTKNDPQVAGAVIHGARPGLAQCSYNFIDSFQHDYRCSTDAPRRKIGLISPEPFGSIFLLKISISALKNESDSDDGVGSCGTIQRTIHEITHGEKKRNRQNPRKTKTTERKRKPKTNMRNSGTRQRSNNGGDRTETAKG